MCGIVGYIGTKKAYPILIKGLKRLEYRGYDSAGIATLENDELRIVKRRGKVSGLEERAEEGGELIGNIGIGHTRWATHGPPNDINSHPHESEDGKMAIIHNGIIENYGALREELTKRGHVFKSDTDTEVLIHLISNIQKNENISLFDAVRIALNEVIGAYAIVVLDKHNPNQLIAAKKGSPLVIGLTRTNLLLQKRAVLWLSDSVRIKSFSLHLMPLRSLNTQRMLFISTTKKLPFWIGRKASP